MKFFYPVKIALSNLLAAKVRSFLTILGIIIGVASVIIIMAVGASAQNLIVGQVQGIGSNLIGVLPGASDEKGPPAQVFGIKITSLKYVDYQAILNKNNAPEIEAGAAYVQGTLTVSNDTKERSESIMGTTHQYPIVQEGDLADGRFFNQGEETNLSRVVVLGSKKKSEYFGAADPIGKKIKIGKEMFSVIGYFTEKGSGGFGTSDQDETFFVPLFTAQKVLLGIDYLSYARFKVRDAKEVELAKLHTERTMRIQHSIDDPKDDDFSVRDQASALETLTTITNVLTYFLALIAAISLLVGGVGIMNIMLITVNERIREVGLRKALGAKRSNIISQFLTEAVTITLLGGMVGIILGTIIALLISVVATALGYDWAFIVRPSSFGLAVSVSVVVGLTFGIYPSLKASRISPMEALRYE